MYIYVYIYYLLTTELLVSTTVCSSRVVPYGPCLVIMCLRTTGAGPSELVIIYSCNVTLGITPFKTCVNVHCMS